MVLQKLVSGFAGIGAREGLKTASKSSVELFGYNFVNLILGLFVYFFVAFIIAKYFEAVIASKGFISAIAGFFGFNLSFPQNDIIAKLFGGGYGDQKIVYWDFIKGLAVVIVVIEWQRFDAIQKANNGQTSALTHGVFSLIVSLLTIITVPKFIEQLKVVV